MRREAPDAREGAGEFALEGVRSVSADFPMQRYREKILHLLQSSSHGRSVHTTAGDSTLLRLASLDLQIEEVDCGQEVD